MVQYIQSLDLALLLSVGIGSVGQTEGRALNYLMGTSKNCPDVGSALGLSGKLAGECGDGADGFFRSFGPLREPGR